MRRANHDKVTAVQYITCKNCGEIAIPHRVCRACGYYKGRLAVAAKNLIG